MKPCPPSTWTPLSAIFITCSAAVLHASTDSRVASRPCSRRLAAFHTSQRSASVSTCMSESMNAMACFCAIASSKATRSLAYGIAYSITARLTPCSSPGAAGAREREQAACDLARLAAEPIGGVDLDAVELQPDARDGAEAELLLDLRHADALRGARHHERVERAEAGHRALRVLRDHEEV